MISMIEKIQHLFIMNIQKKLKYKRYISGPIPQTNSQYYTNWRKIEACTQTWNETGVLTLSTFIYGSI